MAMQRRSQDFLWKTFCVVYCCSFQNDLHSRSGAVQVIDCQCLFIGGSSNNKHNDILRLVSECAAA